jgi:thioredoxin reductase (NADPH)
MYDVIIIGSGPAGYTAAIYTSRSFIKTLILTGPQPGGQLTTTTEVDNFPGFPQGIMGPELLQNMRMQAERFGAEMQQLSADSLQPSDKKTFIIHTGSTTFEARSVIIATGASAKALGIPTEDQFRGKGISYCATCDGFFFRGKNIAVLGGGDTAMEEATFLTKFASHVTIIHRREEFRASPIMVEKAKKDPKISFLLNKEVVEFYGDSVLKGITVRNSKTDTTAMTNTTEKLEFDGVFVAIGYTPATSFLKGTIELDEKGYIKIDEMVRPASLKDSKTATSVEGIFAAGDCTDPRYRQGIVAAGTGAMAAIDVERYLHE